LTPVLPLAFQHGFVPHVCCVRGMRMVAMRAPVPSYRQTA
jgi:hypothetical protein